jgi:5'-methylthioadenosine phosphorylase
MGRLALIGGHSILGAEPGPGFQRREIDVGEGTVVVLERGTTVLLQRHGLSGYSTAARIDHAANLRALAALGCDRVLAFGSVGSLHEELPVGSFICPDDFIALHLGLSLHAGHEGERVPGFDTAWRSRVIETWGAVAEPPLRDGGVYWHAIGPRFETPAEIRLIASHADVIGMTIAAESIIAGELGLAYAAVCVVDNLANGVVAEPLSVQAFQAGKDANRARLIVALDAVAAALEDAG